MGDADPATVAPGAARARPDEVGATTTTVLDSGSDVEVAVLDRTGRIVAVNGAWERFCADNGGDPARCGVGVSYLEVCDRAGDDTTAHRVGASVRTALAGGLPAPMAVEVPCHAPGTMRWFDVLISSRLDDTGGCAGATVTLSLVRTVGRPEVGLVEESRPGGRPPPERLGDAVAHAAFALAPCAVVLADDCGRVVASNAQADDLFGVGPTGLVGMPLGRLFPPRWADAAEPGTVVGTERWADAPYSGRVAVGVRPEGAHLRLHIASAPVPLSYGTGVLVTAVPAGTGPVRDVEGLLADLDAAVRRIFAAGLTLASVRERLDLKGAPARMLADALGDLDRAAQDVRRAGLRRPPPPSPPSPAG